MASIVVPVTTGFMSWRTLREACARIVAAAAPNARVHDQWKLKTDFAKSVAILKPTTGADTGKVHSWMIGVAVVGQEKTSSGDSPIVGGRENIYEIELAIWGFFDYSLGTTTEGSQDVCEAEAELVAAYFAANPWLALDNFVGLAAVKPFEYSSIDVHSSADGQDLHVAQGSMRVTLERPV